MSVLLRIVDVDHKTYQYAVDLAHNLQPFLRQVCRCGVSDKNGRLRLAHRGQAKPPKAPGNIVISFFHEK